MAAKRAAVARAPALAQWVLLVALSAVFAWLFELVHLPGALLLGPMAAGIVLHTSGGHIDLPAIPANAARAIIGLLIARAMTPTVAVEFAREWPVFVGAVLTTIAVSAGVGYLATRLKLLEGTTAIWGLMPGAANVMMLMADAFGADARLVAFMQYLRVVVVAIVASVVAAIFVHAGHTVPVAVNWFPAPDLALLETLVLAAVSGYIGLKSGIGGGIIIGPLLIGSVVHIFGLVPIELPQWLLTLSYAFIGWSVGLKFTREVLAFALRTLPQTMTCILIVVAACGGIGFVLTRILGIDMLTAYLATSPGGADSVAIISQSAKVDVSFVIALQTVRLFVLMATGPILSRVALDPQTGPVTEP